MNIKQRNFEIDMMWRQLGELDGLDQNDFRRGHSVRFQQSSHAFTTGREVHAFLSGALEAVRWLRYQEEKNDG